MTSTPGAADRPAWLLTTLMLVTTTTAVVSSLGAPLVPAIAREHGVSLQAAQWTLTAALITGAVATPVVGRLGGGRRRRTVVLAGLTVVTLGVLLGALPLGFEALLVGRVLQGVGLGMAPLAIAAAREALPAHRLSGAVAMLSVATVAGAGLGYPVTGLVADLAGVGGAFWFGFALCLVTVAMAARFLPAAATEHDGRVDWVGAALLAAGTAAVLLAVSQGNVWGWASPATWGLGLGGVLTIVLWVPLTRRSPYPIVDLRMALERGALAPNTTAVAGGLGMYLLLTLVVVLVQAPSDDGWGLGRPVVVAGLALVPYATFSVLGSRVALAVGRRTTPEAVLPFGCLLYVVAAGYLILRHGTVPDVMVAMSIAGLGSGGTFSTLPGLIVRQVPPDETGSALAFNQVLRYLGHSAGATVAVTVLGSYSADRQPTETGFVAALLVTVGVMTTAAVLSVVLSARRPPTLP